MDVAAVMRSEDATGLGHAKGYGILMYLVEAVQNHLNQRGTAFLPSEPA